MKYFFCSALLLSTLFLSLYSENLTAKEPELQPYVLHYGSLSGHFGMALRLNLDTRYVAGVDFSGTTLTTSRTYGLTNFRLQLLANDFGAALSGHLGYSLTNPVHTPIMIGLEPFTFEFIGTTGHTNNWFEWSPMASIGINAPVGNQCRLIGLFRGGASIGNLGTNGARPAYGVASYMSCENGLGYASEFTRIASENSDVDVVTQEILVPVSESQTGNITTLGIHLDWITQHAGDAHFLFERRSPEDATDLRLFFMVSVIPKRIRHSSEPSFQTTTPPTSEPLESDEQSQ